MSNGNTTETRVVWLVNEGGHDYSDLARFGRVIPLSVGTTNPFKLDRMAMVFAERLRHASPDDYLAISGLPILNGLAMVMWLSKYPKVRLLQWSTRKEVYQEVVLTAHAVANNARRIGDLK